MAAKAESPLFGLGATQPKCLFLFLLVLLLLFLFLQLFLPLFFLLLQLFFLQLALFLPLLQQRGIIAHIVILIGVLLILLLLFIGNLFKSLEREGLYT